MKKNLYKFILILSNVDENTADLEDKLYEAGCDDALINFRNGTVYLDFSREAKSFEDAVISAIKNIESSSLGARVSNIGPEHLVSESDIAKRLHTKRQTISLWIKGARRKDHSFPKPIMKLSEKSPFWKWSDVARWLYQNHLIKEKKIIDDAEFLELMNGALEERDVRVRKLRHHLLKRLPA